MASFDQDYVEGEIDTRYLAIATLTFVVYDHFLTLDDEIRYFWTGKWGVSRTLFIVNRYITPCLSSLSVVLVTLHGPVLQVCNGLLYACLALSISSMFFVQAILVTRIWHMFIRYKTIRVLAVSLFAVCTVATIAIAATGLNNLQFCTPPSLTADFWPLFFPAFVLHTMLYGITAAKGFKSAHHLRNRLISKRLLRDGCLFYLVVFFSVGFAELAAFMKNIPTINLPAVESSFTFAINSVCMSRLMLSIGSLAANLSVDPIWLLNNAEMSRVRWKNGTTEMEIIVEVDAAEGIEMASTDMANVPGGSQRSRESGYSDNDDAASLPLYQNSDRNDAKI
ncbi:hypothetical protein PLICRDRAFT_88465 [Plicaturopsis crispa FD-325 SS-3]|nr:hypothetical protein PLICRDRAFT_88465 [Plicaturopsis crispa FD-325 SS-3]